MTLFSINIQKYYKIIFTIFKWNAVHLNGYIVRLNRTIECWNVSTFSIIRFIHFSAQYEF